MLYERGATWTDTDNDQDVAAPTGDGNGNSYAYGQWEQGGTNDERNYYWSSQGKNADEYLTRLTYQPMGVSKANVAVKN